MSFIAYLVAIIIFILVAFGVTVGSVDGHELTAVGLACFALGHVLPGTLADLRSRA